MCWKKIFGHTEPLPPMEAVERRLLTFGKNKYGGGNDLNGCVNDSNNLAKKVTELFPDFDVRKFTDSQVTASNYLARTSEAIALLRPGATVIVPMDSCFSGTATRLNNNQYKIRNRYYDPGLPLVKTVRTKIARTGEINWIAISGCGEHQTSADAYIGSGYVGAFTYYAIQCIRKGMTYREWHEEIRSYLPSDVFDQAPEIEGPEILLNRKVFEGQTLIIHNSSHGSWQYENHTNPDEIDGRDEGIYFDRLVIDDEINKILQNIPSIN